MSGRQKKKKKEPKREDDRKSKDDAIIADTAAVFTCAKNTVRDFNEQCTDGLEAVEADLAFNRVAHALWHGREGVEALVSALDDYATERQRHLEALRELGKRFTALASDTNLTEHQLNPPQAYYEFIRQRLFPDSVES